MCPDLIPAATDEQAWLRELLAASPCTVYALELANGVLAPVWVSAHVSRVLGYTPGEVLAPSFWPEHVHPDDRAVAEQVAAELGRSGRAAVEYRFRHRDGSYRWLSDELRLAPGGGDRQRVVGSWIDVTERKRIEEALRESEERFRLAFVNAPIGMAVVGLDGRFLQVNQALCRILRRTPAELLTMTVEQLTHPDDRATEASHKSDLQDGQAPSFHMVKRYLRPDGTVVWGQLSVSAVHDAAGRPLYTIGQLEDITERKQAEAALQLSEERFRLLIDKSSDILVTLDAEGRIRFANPALGQALGRPVDGLVGHDGFDLIHPEDRGRARGLFALLGAEPGRTDRIVLRAAHADGSWRLFDSIATSLFHLPAVRGLVINARDVTDQHRLQEQFGRAQRLESIGRLAGGIAHDFNNLLTAVIGYSDLLDAAPPGAPADRLALIEIRRAAERAGELTRQLLAVARRQVSVPRPENLNLVVAHAERMLRRVLGEDILLEVRLAEDLWPIHADAAQLEQVILNLAINARDAMPHGGRLTIATRNLEVTPANRPDCGDCEPGPSIELRVADSGSGMPPEVVAHLFEPFFTTKPDGQGSGLGLASVYGIVRQAGGAIAVDSSPGAGSVFRIYWPRTAEAAAPRPQPAALTAAAPRGAERILLVEDDAAVRDLTVECLGQAGYAVTAASSAAEALRLLEAGAAHPDLLLSDVIMPGMSGKELAERLRHRQPGLAVLFMSGHAEDVLTHDGILEPGVDFVAKPFRLGALLVAVRAVLDRPRPG